MNWTAQQDDALMEMIADGASFAKAGEALGRTKGSCLSRFRLLAARMGWQAQ